MEATLTTLGFELALWLAAHCVTLPVDPMSHLPIAATDSVQVIPGGWKTWNADGTVTVCRCK